MRQDSFDAIFKGKKRVMAVMPHPDDNELYCGGTICRLIASDIEVMAVKLTNGGKGTKQNEISESELTALRSKEDRAAAEALGIRPDMNIQLNIPDGEVENNLQTIGQVSFLIRQFRPDLIITTNPEDFIITFDKDQNWVNHRDHRHTAQVAIDAAYPYSRDRAFFPLQLRNSTEAYKPTTIFLLTDYYHHPDTIYIDITDYFQAKLKAWVCHESAYTADGALFTGEYLNKVGDKYYETFRLVIAD